MEKELSLDKIISICESEGWWVTDCGDELELEQYSPAGEDFIVSLPKKDFVKELVRYTEDFSPDEHAAGWYGQNNGEPSSLRDLLDDAEAIQTMLESLCKWLSREEGKGNCADYTEV